MAGSLRFLFVGDLMGEPGLKVFSRQLPKLKEQYSVDSVIVNGENSNKNGKGITERIAKKLVELGVSVITSGNHIWQNKEVYEYLNKTNVLLRPANYPSDCPGKGYTFYDINNKMIAVLNLQGRGFMRDHIDCPFRKADSLLPLLRAQANIVLVDFHAETTAEKQALAFYLDGRISSFFGTHTHVQTADERILPKGCAYITDAGFTGAQNSVIGVEKEIIIRKQLTQLPAKFKVEITPPFVLNGVFVEINSSTGKAITIERVKVIDEQPID